MNETKRPSGTKLELVSVSIDSIQPSPENDRIYRPVAADDPSVISLARSIKQNGVQEPIVVTSDNFILSGHRRLVAAKLAGLKRIPIRRERISRERSSDQFLQRLIAYNEQRVKRGDEIAREAVAQASPEQAMAEIVEYRRRKSALAGPALHLNGTTTRCAISAAKEPFILSVQAVIESFRKFWPLSERTIHYNLLNDPPLIHASKPSSTYRNDRKSSQALSELCVRARLAGLIPWEAIADDTRSVQTWDVHQHTGPYVRRQIDGMLKNYWRDLMQSQPVHIEVVGEKFTVKPIIEPVCAEFTIPCTIGRGFCSLPPRHAMAERFRASGRDGLVLLLLSDHDPDGEEISLSFARSMRDDFGISQITARKVAITAEQVNKHNLPPMLKAKATSAHYAKFIDQHGEHAYELEALAPTVLQQILRDAILAAVDIHALNAERQREREEQQFLRGLRAAAVQAIDEATSAHEGDHA